MNALFKQAGDRFCVCVFESRQHKAFTMKVQKLMTFKSVQEETAFAPLFQGLLYVTWFH